jgi:hypothetical protein
MIRLENIVNINWVSISIEFLFQNKISASKQNALTDILNDKKLPSTDKKVLISLISDYFDQPNAEILIDLLNQNGFSTLSKSNLINIINTNQQTSTAVLNLLSLFEQKSLSVSGQQTFLETLSADNLQPSSQTSLINSASLINQTGSNLESVLDLFSKITLSSFNLPKIVDLFRNGSSDLTATSNQLKILGETINNKLDSIGDQGLNTLLQNYTGFLGPCLTNCSMHGDCESINGTLSCFCKRLYQGDDCSVSSNPCDADSCLNNSTCVLKPDFNNPKILSFECACLDLFYGAYCENKIDVCSNETCSKHGNCVDRDDRAECECWEFYFGRVCENQVEEIVIRKKVSMVSMSVVVGFICGFYILIILFDVLKFCCRI